MRCRPDLPWDEVSAPAVDSFLASFLPCVLVGVVGQLRRGLGRRRRRGRGHLAAVGLGGRAHQCAVVGLAGGGVRHEGHVGAVVGRRRAGGRVEQGGDVVAVAVAVTTGGLDGLALGGVVSSSASSLSLVARPRSRWPWPCDGRRRGHRLVLALRVAVAVLGGIVLVASLISGGARGADDRGRVVGGRRVGHGGHVAIAPPALIIAAATAIEATRRLRARALASEVSTGASGRYGGMRAMTGAMTDDVRDHAVPTPAHRPQSPARYRL